MAASAELPRSGDFVTRELLGLPLLLRNVGDSVRAFVNVCPHRHCLITSCERGSSPIIRCQYHGWEYDKEGAVSMIPDVESFTPAKRGMAVLRQLPTTACGPLLFVSLDESPAPIDQVLATETLALLNPPDDAGLVWASSRERDYPMNWRVAVEAAFVSDSDIEGATRVAGPRHAELRGTGAWARSTLPRLFAEAVGSHCEQGDLRHHSFPNLLIARTPLTTLVQAITPISETRARSRELLFVHRGARHGLGSSWRALATPAMKWIARGLQELR